MGTLPRMYLSWSKPHTYANVASGAPGLVSTPRKFCSCMAT